MIHYNELSDADKARNDFWGVTPEQTGFHVPPNGCFSKCSDFPCSTCKYYYGEAHECMYGEDSSLDAVADSLIPD